MSTATLTSKGQLTLPKKIRDQLGLSAGDKVNFVLMKDGKAKPPTMRVREWHRLSDTRTCSAIFSP